MKMQLLNLKRFLKFIQNIKILDYAYYLLAICYYEQIVDEKKDLQAIRLMQKNNFEILDKTLSGYRLCN